MTEDAQPDYFLGGYFLVRGGKPSSELLPDPFWILGCLSDLLPCIHVPWDEISDEYRTYWRNELPPSRSDEMFRWARALYDAGEFGFGDVFLTLASARSCYERYLRSVENVKLLEISLPDPFVDEFLDKESVFGISDNLSKRILVCRDDSAVVRGFDILGEEYVANGSFHCFACNYLQEDYTTKLGIRLNEFGLIPALEDAVRAADYTNLDSTGAEPALWQPWLVREFSLNPGG